MTTPLAEIEKQIDALEGAAAADKAARLLALGEEVLEHWVLAREEEPTDGEHEGFRLLALHRQGSRGEPSFNACRETCRELVYHYNLVNLEPEHEDVDRRAEMMRMVANHLYLFVSGKMQVAGLGDFCCASKPVRMTGAEAAH